MIFEEVVLHNFGVYQGRHSIQLDVSVDRPVVLVGAMNGSGKTTFLDAMQLALYGKSARCTGRERVSYSDYLASMVNRGVPPSHGAGIEFALRTRSNGKDSQIRIQRSWAVRSSGVKDNLEIFRDGILDSVASERWQEFVEDLMPSQIADLFFFDGEKIEALADPARSASLLRVGVHSLLGIDLVESLIKSLQLVEKRRKVSGSSQADRGTYLSLIGEKEGLEEKRKLNSETAATLRTESDKLKQRIEETREEFKRIGGELFERHDQLLMDRAALERQHAELGERLQVLVADVLPLNLIGDLLQRIAEKAASSQSSRDLQLLNAVSAERDSEMIAYLRLQGLEENLLSQVQRYLETDRRQRFSGTVASIDLPAGILDQFKPDLLRTVRSDAAACLAANTDVTERLAVIDRHLMAVPSEGDIAPVRQRLDQYLHEQAHNSLQTAMLEVEGRELERKIALAEQQINRESDRLSLEASRNETSQRVVSHSIRSRDTLSVFREKLLTNNLERLERAITRCFKQLLRKQSLVSDVIIDSVSFELSVIHPNGKKVAASRLSAGERQLLAVATLWALSQASGRHLPTVIDTPLSRLDSRHRGTIVQNYFPLASHQVILLSTDEEVVGRYYKMLQGHIGREYLIDHDEAKSTSMFREGCYFSMNSSHEVEPA